MYKDLDINLNMLEINYIHENKASVIARLQKRHLNNAADLIENILSINQQRKETQLALDTVSAQVNQLTKQIEQLLQAGKKQEIENLKLQSKELKASIKELEAKLHTCKETLQHKLDELP
ncbi:serine--tRNA ligase, partial [Rhizobium leguminosarum]|nr:serine--tRNA ligase [Rhizobium leguminosarum]